MNHQLVHDARLGSALRHLNNNIDGINRPWLYLGMLYASFCWHREVCFVRGRNIRTYADTRVQAYHTGTCTCTTQTHKRVCNWIQDVYLASMNYLHVGANKQWYGIPGSKASKVLFDTKKLTNTLSCTPAHSHIHTPKFNSVMKRIMKLRLDEDPDLEHHITTQIDPQVSECICETYQMFLNHVYALHTNTSTRTATYTYTDTRAYAFMKPHTYKYT